MTNFWNTTGLSASSGVFWLHIHCFLGLLALVGLILLIVWAIRSLQKEQLKTLAIWLLVIGVVGSLLTAPLAMAGWSWFLSQRHGGYMKGGSMMMGGGGMQMMHEMMEEHGERVGEESGEHGEMEEMMQRMMQ